VEGELLPVTSVIWHGELRYAKYLICFGQTGQESAWIGSQRVDVAELPEPLLGTKLAALNLRRKSVAHFGDVRRGAGRKWSVFLIKFRTNAVFGRVGYAKEHTDEYRSVFGSSD
jgi:hypothetical protein